MEITNDLNYPPPFISFVTEHKGEKPTPKSIRVTELIDAPRIRFLKMKYWDRLKIKASSLQSSCIGQVFHDAMKKYIPDSWGGEERLSIEVDGITITGQPDLWSPDGCLYDWKTTQTWSYINTKAEWEAQTNVYTYLLAKVKDIKIKNIEVCALFLNYSPSRAGQSDMPPDRFVRMPQPVWPLDITEAYIRERLEDHKADRPCSDFEKWLDKECYMWYPKHRPSGIKFYNKEEALAKMSPGDKLVHRPAKARRCSLYCPVYDFCPDTKRV